ncbi:MAG: Gfo/Idh/MocA family oxidoreductase [Armatimonadota bacterium]|nr:Gfo/Idh/MocA family oxidoreductase [Armatimonadota bacterium]
MSEETYGFGLVGCGVIAPTHAEAIRRLDNAELRAVCDLDEEAANACAADFDARPYTDLDEMLARDDINVVNVLTPSGLHAKLGIQCADAGKHVICTKPIDITLENIDALIEAGERNGVKIAATHQLRSYPLYEKIKRYIDEGRLGEMLYGNAFVPWFRSDDYYTDSWHGTKALDGGGALINQSIHYIDLLIWLLGRVERIFGFADALAHDMIEVEDMASAVLEFESGAQGVIQGSTCTYKGMPARIEVHGTGGNVMATGDELVLWDVEGDNYFSDWGAGNTGGAADPKAGMPEAAVVAHVKQIGDVLNAIEEGREPILSAREARRPVEVILAIYQASESGQVVELG